MREAIHSLFEKAVKGNVVLSFEGVITSELLDCVFAEAEAKLKADQETLKSALQKSIDALEEDRAQNLNLRLQNAKLLKEKQ